jgi:hypothetical protein
MWNVKKILYIILTGFTVSGFMKALGNYFHSGNYQIRILIGALFTAIVADGIITMYLIQNGLAQEGNPFMVYWVAENRLISLKICGGILVGICLWSMHNRRPRLSVIFTSILLTGYIFIIIWNLLILW